MAGQSLRIVRKIEVMTKMERTVSLLLALTTLSLIVQGAVSAASGKNNDSLTLEEAQQYMLSLINKHRLKAHLQPVVLDAVASMAAQRHAVEEAALGYSAHWDTNGLIADTRYSDVGGRDVVMENNLGSVCDKKFDARLDPNQTFRKEDLDKVDSLFFDEKPPNDGHRLNILRPTHTAVGIGLASCVQTSREYGNSWRTPTCVEEFVDHLAEVEDHLPKVTWVGGAGTVQGKPVDGYQIYGFTIRRDEAPRRRTVEELRAIPAGQGYFLPQQIVCSLWPQKDFQLNSDGSFVASIVFKPDWQPGLYYVELWCKSNEGGDPIVAFRKAVLLKPPG